MNQTEATASMERAVKIARNAWAEAHRGLPANPLTRTADIVATAAIAAGLIGRPHVDADTLTREATEAIRIARRVSDRVADDTHANPMARTAEKAAIGILAAGLLAQHEPAPSAAAR